MNALKDDGVMKAIRGSQADIFMNVIETKKPANSAETEVKAY